MLSSRELEQSVRVGADILEVYYQLREAGWDGLDALRLARWYALGLLA
jgi:hypothetical protein